MVHNVTFSNGETLKVSKKDYWKRTGAFQKRLNKTPYGTIQFFFLIGLELAIGSDDCAIEKGPGLQGIRSPDSCRLALLTQTKSLFSRGMYANHPMASNVLAAIEAEINSK